MGVILRKPLKRDWRNYSVAGLIITLETLLVLAYRWRNLGINCNTYLYSIYESD